MNEYPQMPSLSLTLFPNQNLVLLLVALGLLFLGQSALHRLGPLGPMHQHHQVRCAGAVEIETAALAIGFTIRWK